VKHVIIEYVDGSREEMNLERYRNRVFTRAPSLLTARVRFVDKTHFDREELELWRQGRLSNMPVAA